MCIDMCIDIHMEMSTYMCIEMHVSALLSARVYTHVYVWACDMYEHADVQYMHKCEDLQTWCVPDSQVHLQF